jgi:Putative metal-binding motif
MQTTSVTRKPGPRNSPALVRVRRCAALLLSVLMLVCLPGRAQAHANGAGAGCDGCHSGGKTPTVLITPNVTTINPGQLVTLTISISASNGTTAGFYLGATTGRLSIIDSGTKAYGDNGLGATHNTPRKGSGSTITFTVGWTAPATPGGVDFNVWGNSANGDGRSSGDGIGLGFYSVAFGCTGIKYYRDFDGDGVGIDTSYTMACSLPQYYAAKAGDCNENDEHIFPGAPEICDGKDNNCDGQIDEGLPITMYCTDADGDGHGVVGQATVMACGVSKGFGLCDRDCNDTDPKIYPGATELCNNKDDNCNGRIDENARAVCGTGWCAKYADGCSSTCVPGAPRAEECNFFDDDCDGVIDNGTNLQLCGDPGLECHSGACVPAGSGNGGGPSVGGGVTSFGGSGTSGTASGTPGANPQPVQPGSAGQGPSASNAAPSGCNFGLAPGRNALAAAGLLLGLGALVRRSRRSRSTRR